MCALQASQNVSEEEIANYDVDLNELKAEFAAAQEAEAEMQAAKDAKSADIEPTADLGKEIITQAAWSLS